MFILSGQVGMSVAVLQDFIATNIRSIIIRIHLKTMKTVKKPVHFQIVMIELVKGKAHAAIKIEIQQCTPVIIKILINEFYLPKTSPSKLICISESEGKKENPL